MGRSKRHVIILADEGCDALVREVEDRGFLVSTDPGAAESPDFALVASARELDAETLRRCDELVAQLPTVPVLLLSKVGRRETPAVIRAGQYDFLEDPHDLEELLIALQSAVRQIEAPAPTYDGRFEFHGLIGGCPKTRELCGLLEQVAKSRASVLITGETGTGKEVAAFAIHDGSKRSSRPFVAINCAAIPEALLESDLFGHARGAFTGARSSREGLLQHAKGGSLFLDEIGDMPLGLQAKLLRVIETQKVRPVGSDQEVPIDVRFIAATHCDLKVAVQEGRFREDLLYRLNVIHVEMPPLSERGQDVLILAEHFLERVGRRSGRGKVRLSRAVCQRLLEYDWPGNIRELSNCIERALALSPSDEIRVEDLPDELRTGPIRAPAGEPDLSALLPIAEIERRYILRVLEIVGGNKTAAARVLQLDRRTLYRKLNLYEGKRAQIIERTPSGRHRRRDIFERRL